MPVRILLITGSLGPGGTELAVVSLARGLNTRGRAVPHVAVLGSAGSYGPLLRSEGIVVHELGIQGALRTPGRIRTLLQLADIVRREKIGIVHTFLFDADVYGMLAARMGGPWSVVTTRRAIKKDRPLHLLGYRLTNGFVDRIVCNSEAVRDFTLKKENPPSDKVRVIPNGVDLDRYAGGGRDLFRARLGVGADTLLVGAVGTIKKVKGQAVLLDAMIPLLRHYPNVTLCLAGEVTRGYGESLRARAESEGLASRVLFPGVVTEVPDLLAALDLFVLPSLSEGMSNALMEAMAAGKAIVATAVGGNAENLDNGSAGLLVPPGDPIALSAAIQSMLDARSQRDGFALRARARARAEYAYSRVLDRTELLYSELVEELFGKIFRERLELPAPTASELEPTMRR